MKDFSLIDRVSEYNTSFDPTNAPPDSLVSGSKNTLIDGRNGKVQLRNGYSHLGATNSALTPVRGAKTWNNSTGGELPMRVYDDELEVFIGTVDGVDVDSWNRVINSLSTTEIPRFDTWWDTTENLDLLLWVIGDDNISEWGGGIAVVDSVAASTITKKGTNTFAQNRSYTTRNLVFRCVRTGTNFTYTGGTGTTTLTGVTPDPTANDLIDGDILVQTVVTQSNKPAADRLNDTIIVFENQLVLGSFDDNEVFLSKNDDYFDFTFSAPRIAGEGGLLTLEARSQGMGIVSDKLVLFAGRDSIFKAIYQEITVGSTLTESLTADKMKTGVEQGAQSPDCIVPVGNELMYLSFEPTLRILEQPESIEGPQLRTLSNPIKPDFDDETWTNAHGIWHKNAFFLSAPTNSRVYVLEFIEDSDGRLRRFWQPPQILPVRAFSIISGNLHGHSNSIAETYRLFDPDTNSDISSNSDKIPINGIAAFAYRTFDKRALLKSFDEYFIEGEITPSTNDLALILNYDFGGHTQIVERTINGTDEDILQESVVGVSLGQAPLGQQPIGGITTSPSNARRFNVVFEIAKEDFKKIQAVFSVNNVDRFFSILAHGPKVVLSSRRDTTIKK